MKLNRYNEAAGNFKYAIERSVLKDARATPFLSDFIQAFEKVDDGQKEKFNECLEVCKAGLMEQNAAPNSYDTFPPPKRIKQLEVGIFFLLVVKIVQR